MNCATHFHACDCREAEFARIEAQRDTLADLVREAVTNDPVGVPADWLRRAKAALEALE